MIWSKINSIKDLLSNKTTAKKVELGVRDFKPSQYPLICIDYATSSEVSGIAKPMTSIAYVVPIKIYSRREHEDLAIQLEDEVIEALMNLTGSTKGLEGTTITQEYDRDDFIITINYIAYIAITRRT